MGREPAQWGLVGGGGVGRDEGRGRRSLYHIARVKIFFSWVFSVVMYPFYFPFYSDCIA